MYIADSFTYSSTQINWSEKKTRPLSYRWIRRLGLGATSSVMSVTLSAFLSFSQVFRYGDKTPSWRLTRVPHVASEPSHSRNWDVVILTRRRRGFGLPTKTLRCWCFFNFFYAMRSNEPLTGTFTTCPAVYYCSRQLSSCIISSPVKTEYGRQLRNSFGIEFDLFLGAECATYSTRANVN